MSLIKILAGGETIDFVKETLNIRKENNSLSQNFKVSYSTYPFLVVENKTAKQQLGPRELTSVNKKKVIKVTVYEDDVEYEGELQVLSYINGFRKCNLKYASKILSLMSKKIGEFLPTVSVSNESDDTLIVPFSENSDAPVAGDGGWASYPELFIAKGFPEVKWNFPTMAWVNKFGVDLPADDPWILFKNKVNLFLDDGYVVNTYNYVTPSEIDVKNINVPMPQVYLLSPLFYALAEIGYTFEGDFTTMAFIRKLMFLSFKDNLTKIKLLTTTTDVTFVGSWIDISGVPWPLFYKLETDTIAETGTYTIKIDFVLDAQPTTAGPAKFTSLEVRRYVLSVFGVWVKEDYEIVFERGYTEAGERITGEFDMYFEAGDEIRFYYASVYQVMPVSYELSYRKANEDKEFYQLHPTIPLSRYVPDWNFSTYINQLKNWFNLDIEPDDLRKKLKLNFNEDWIKTALPEVLKKSLAITSYDQNGYEAFWIKFENDDDESLWIMQDSVAKYENQTSDFLQTIESKFKYVPVSSATAHLSDDLEARDGTGLIIYDEQKLPNVSESFDGISLDVQSIYNNFHKKWLKFRLNASIIEFNGNFTKIEIAKILNKKKIFIDHQLYVISSIEAKELKQDNYAIIIKVESVNF